MIPHSCLSPKWTICPTTLSDLEEDNIPQMILVPRFLKHNIVCAPDKISQYSFNMDPPTATINIPTIKNKPNRKR